MPSKLIQRARNGLIAASRKSVSRRRLPDPFPADLLGKRLCEIFSYPWQPIVALMPEDATEKPAWQTLTRYPLKPRALWMLWQDAGQLVGVRFGKTTDYALIDIDASSVYHPNYGLEGLKSIQAALETIGITRTILLRSSWSGGLHLFIPLPEALPTFGIAVAIKHCLETHNLFLKPGHLEVFPNVKRYGKAGDFVEYNAHRLPLQPGSGSFLVGNDLQVVKGGLECFFELWDTAGAGQDLEELQQAIATARQQHSYRLRACSNQVEVWQQELLAEITEGWTGQGQTNHLLKTIACYGVVFLGLSGQTLVEYVQQKAISCPGYLEWCRHQHEILQRSQDWAAAAEGYYWPMGTPPKRSGNVHRVGAENNIVPFNQRRAEEAQARIKQAITELENQGQLPTGMTARMKAIAAQARCSFTTLQKYKELWCPQQSVTALLEPDKANSEEQSIEAVATLDSSSEKELHTNVYMKGGGLGSCSKEKIFSFSFGEGAGRGGTRFPQPEIIQQFPKLDALPEPIDDLSDVISGIQIQVRRLRWSVGQGNRFIAEQFQGKRRSQLTDDELVLLLYRLQQLNH